MTTQYFATKYDSPQHEFLHDLAAIWSVDWTGNVESPAGSFCALDFTPADLAQIRTDAAEAVAKYQDTWLSTCLADLDKYAPETVMVTELFGVQMRNPSPDIITELAKVDYYAPIFGYHLLSTNDQGFCYVESFLTEEERDDKFALYLEEYEKWEGTDEEDN